METNPYQDELSLLILRATLRGKYAMVELAEKHGITLMQTFALCLLEPGKSVPTNSLSNFLLCDPSNVTGIVDRLVAESLIERKESEKDRRVKTITLTTAGTKLRHEFLRLAAETRLPKLDSLSQGEQETLIALIRKATGDTV